MRYKCKERFGIRKKTRYLCAGIDKYGMYRRTIIATVALLCGCLAASSQQYQKQREAVVEQNVPLSAFRQAQRVLFNFGWRFNHASGSAARDYDDSAWRKVDLPHDFQFELPWQEDAGGARGFKPMGEAWYRKTFKADSLWMGRHVVLDFGGLMYFGDVYMNGVKVGSAEYGYCGFECDVTKALRYDTLNVVAVYASTGKKNGSRWYTGGGLFRDVFLKVQNPTHIARHGLYVYTPEVSREEATVQVEVEVTGFRRHKIEVVATLFTAEGKQIVSVRDTMNQLTKHTTDELRMMPMTVKAPKLWSPDTPNLYRCRADVFDDGILVDQQETWFGIRKIEYGTDFGFKLNGEKVFLKGIANHHDLGALGVAAFDDAIERQMRQMKAFGFNAIRCSHNPYSENFTKIADRVGLLVVDELIDKWSDNEYWGGRKPFTSLWPELIKEWVKRDRNSPSVILWSLGNELQTRRDWSGYDTNDWGITTYRIFDVMLKRYDKTRPTTVAQFPARAGGIREEKEFKTYRVAPELGVATEVNSFNYQWDAYPGYYEHAPGLILFQSEAVTNQLVAPFYGMDRERGVGLAYWGAIEYWGESNKWPKKGWNYSWFSHTLRPYPQAYLVKGAFEPEKPVVHIGVMNGGESVNWNDVNVGQKTYSDSWNWREDSRKQVCAFTNAEEVELFHNSKSLGRVKNDTSDVFRRGVCTWQSVEYGKGGQLTAVAYNKGKEVARHTIETTGGEETLVIEEEEILNKAFKADGMSLKYLWVRAVDGKGRTVPTADEEITVTVSGAAALVTLDNGDHYTDELFVPESRVIHSGFAYQGLMNVKEAEITSMTRKMREGRMLIILRARDRKGNSQVQVTSPYFKPVKRIVKVVQ